MPYFRFDEMKSHHLNPHLSTTQGPVIEAETMYFRCVTKKPGEQSRQTRHAGAYSLQRTTQFSRARSGHTLSLPQRSHLDPGAPYQWTVAAQGPARYAIARSTTRLEQHVARNGAADNWRG